MLSAATVRVPARGPLRAGLLVAWVLLAACRTGETDEPLVSRGEEIDVGLLVTGVSGGALARAGLRSDDVLLAYRPAAGGDWVEFETPFDLWQAGRLVPATGATVLRWRRGPRPVEAEVPAGQWQVETTLVLSGELERRRSALLERAAGVAERAAVDALLRDFDAWMGDAEPGSALLGDERRAWLLYELAQEVAADRPLEFVESLLQTSRELSATHVHASMQTWAAEADAARRRGAFDEARAARDQELAGWRRLGSQLGEGIALALTCRLEAERGRPEPAQALCLEAVEVIEAAAPDSLELQRVWRHLARTYADLDEQARAMAWAERALHLVEQLAPDGYDHQASLMLRGIFHWFAEDWRRAERDFRACQQMIASVDPQHPDNGNVLRNLGLVASKRGDLLQAAEYYERSLALVDQDAMNRTRAMNSLGTLAQARNDLSTAERWYREVLEIRRVITPDSAAMITPLLNLSQVYFLQERAQEALPFIDEALELQQLHSPASRDGASLRLLLARAEFARGEFEAAERSIEGVLEILERFRNVEVGGTQQEAETLVFRARVLEAVGRGDDALAAVDQGIALHELLAPGTSELAGARYQRARVQRARGFLDEAWLDYLAAMDTLDEQFARLGGSDEARSRFRGFFDQLYRDAAELALERGDEEAAFAILQRARAGSLLAMLVERGLDSAAQQVRLAGIDPELARRWDRLSARREALRADLDALSPSAMDERQRISGELYGIEVQIDSLIEAPVLRGGQQPMAETLPQGTVAVSFFLSAERARAFVLRDGSRRLVELPTTAGDLEDLVERYRLLLETAPPVGDRPDWGFAELGARLYDVLLRPLDLWPAEELVIVPDGPLHGLPLAALVVSGGGGGTGSALARPEFLIDRAPFQVASSLSVYRQLAERRRGSTPTASRPTILALANPMVDSTSAAAARAVVRAELGELPFAESEVRSIRETFPERTELLLGDQAQEQRVKADLSDFRVLHFATHGVLDHRSPLESGLVLASGVDARGLHHNGLLQAWEVFSRVRVDADLVTLSACDTGRGEVLGSEGLIGLTRAFQHAGARGVVASLWQVRDESTAVLMEEFYRQVAEGAAFHEALRRAQQKLLEHDAGTDGTGQLLAHPHHWAGFQVYGYGSEALER